MTKYIDADKLTTKLRKHLIPTVLDRDYDEWENGKDAGLQQAINIVESLQQEQSEVKLEKEIDKEWAKCEPIDEGMGLESANIVNEQFDSIARHFYELGLNARNEE